GSIKHSPWRGCRSRYCPWRRSAIMFSLQGSRKERSVMSDVSEAAEPGTSVSRRDFLAVGGLSVVGLSVAEQAALNRARERSGARSCILVVMSGGPSQLETFDPKPQAPRHIRGPLQPIATAIPGVQFSEGLPQL